MVRAGEKLGCILKTAALMLPDTEKKESLPHSELSTALCGAGERHVFG